MLDVVCIRKSISWYDYSPRLASVSIPLHGTTLFIMDGLSHTGPFAFSRLLSIAAVIEWPTNPFTTNRYPIVDILCLMSVEIVFSLLSNVRLLGIFIRPQANASLWVYWQPISRKICNALLESILNHILNKTSYNYRWRIYIWSTKFPFYSRPWYITYQIQNVKKNGFF